MGGVALGILMLTFLLYYYKRVLDIEGVQKALAENDPSMIENNSLVIFKQALTDELLFTIYACSAAVVLIVIVYALVFAILSDTSQLDPIAWSSHYLDGCNVKVFSPKYCIYEYVYERL